MKSESLCSDALSVELDRILTGSLLQSLFQPVIDVSAGLVFGYEALSRGPSDSPLHGAQTLFDTADRCGRAGELERSCLEASAQRWLALGQPGRLFVNVSPENLMPSSAERGRLMDLVRVHGLDPEQIVIELSERYPAQRPEALMKSLQWLNEQGFRIAIDDLGVGYSGLKLWSDIRPDFVKIDRHFIRGINDDLVKKQFVQSLVDLADRLGCDVIAEGVETSAELQHIKDLHIHLVQGFLFGRPKPRPMADLTPLEVDRRFPATIHRRAASLSEYVESVAPTVLLTDAWELMQKKPDMFSLPIVADGQPLGLLHRWHILEIYSTPYGRALFDRQPVNQLMDTEAMVVEADLSIEEVSQRLVDEDIYYLKQHFIVVKQGRYLGLGTSRRVLQEMTKQRIENARHANPLTSLPGNVIIQQTLERVVQAENTMMLVYFDISHFKPLNDTLGYRVGDRVIIRLADILRALFWEPTDFLGHVGGDDFVVVTANEAIRDLCIKARDQFADAVHSLYPAVARQTGKVDALNRTGEASSFPLASLAAGILWVEPGSGLTADQLADYLTMVKGQAKRSLQGVSEASTSALEQNFFGTH